MPNLDMGPEYSSDIAGDGPTCSRKLRLCEVLDVQGKGLCLYRAITMWQIHNQDKVFLDSHKWDEKHEWRALQFKHKVLNFMATQNTSRFDPPIWPEPTTASPQI